MSDLAAEKAKASGDAENADAPTLATRSLTLRPADAVRNPAELARQLTLMEQRLFRAISRRCILFYVMHPKQRDQPLAQPVRTFITHFNKVACRAPDIPGGPLGR